LLLASVHSDKEFVDSFFLNLAADTEASRLQFLIGDNGEKDVRMRCLACACCC
jgi:hypothetical protein